MLGEKDVGEVFLFFMLITEIQFFVTSVYVIPVLVGYANFRGVIIDLTHSLLIVRWNRFSNLFLRVLVHHTVAAMARPLSVFYHIADLVFNGFKPLMPSTSHKDLPSLVHQATRIFALS